MTTQLTFWQRYTAAAYNKPPSRGTCPNCRAGSMRDVSTEQRAAMAVVTAQCDRCGHQAPRLERSTGGGSDR